MELTLINRNNLTLTNVKKVKSSEPELIQIMLDNTGLLVSGTNLSVEQLDIQTGLMQISGQVDCVKYTNKTTKKFSFKNIFK